MPKKVLVLGSGPIVIGQAAEFDYSGTQACLALRQYGVKTIVVNPNPATIQTDHQIADVVYLKPLEATSIERIMAEERPDGLLATFGGQTALNVSLQLADSGVLARLGVLFLGTSAESIRRAEDRVEFIKAMQAIGEPTLPSRGVASVDEALAYAGQTGFPLIVRSAFTLGGAGGGVACTRDELAVCVENGLVASPIGQVLIEQSVFGWGEFEFEIVRDSVGNHICVCAMENVNPMGIHTGDSIVVAPTQTLSNDDFQRLRSAALRIADELKIIGSCNVQFAFDYATGRYVVVEVNPRLSRSSALASKATGYPIAKVAAILALGQTLPGSSNDITGKSAMFEPSLDYVVVKMPCWPFDKFPSLARDLGVSMKSTGEVMAMAQSFEEAFAKALASLKLSPDSIESTLSGEDICVRLAKTTSDQILWVLHALSRGVPNDKIAAATHIHPWFVEHLAGLVAEPFQTEPTKSFRAVDSCAAEFLARTPYFYSTRGGSHDAKALTMPSVLIVGSGPIRIGQGIEFDYMTVHAVNALRNLGLASIIINNNPATVSTDYAMADRLYLEPLTPKDVERVIAHERSSLIGAICQFGGQTALSLATAIDATGLPILGTSLASIEMAENRAACSGALSGLGVSLPAWTTAGSPDEILVACRRIGFPLLIRPSFVLAGDGMLIARDEAAVASYLANLPAGSFSAPTLIDRYVSDAIEVDMDVISDGQDEMIYILEQLEPAGVHSGDSRCVYPAQHLDKSVIKRLKEVARCIVRHFGLIGASNIQAAIKNDEIFVIEVNPRASRTIPFLSKALDLPLANIATQILVGKKLRDLMPLEQSTKMPIAIKSPVFSFHKLPGLSRELGPVMKSTGEVMSTGATFDEALANLNGDF